MKQILLRFLTVERIEVDPGALEHALRVATAVLLVEVMRADFRVDPDERRRLRDLLSGQFDLTAELLYVSHPEFIQARHKAEEAASG